MIERIFPRTIDPSYRGSKAALWLLGLLAAVKMAMGLNCIINGRTVLITADGVPLATFPAAAAQTVVAMFAIWAWSLLLFALLAALVLVRYRSLTPFMFTFFIVEHLGRKLILQSIPTVRNPDAPASWINAILLSVMVLGLSLSLWRRGASTVQRVAGDAANH